MCTGAEIATIVAATATVYSASQAGKVPKMPDPLQPEKPPQAARDPDISDIRRQNKAGMIGGMPNAGPSSTMLTGIGGVDPASLTLGRNTLLGG